MLVLSDHEVPIHLPLMHSLSGLLATNNIDCIFQTHAQLKPGESFGSLEGSGEDHVIRCSYPMYYSNEPCTLLRITQVDYQRVVQVRNSSVSLPSACNISPIVTYLEPLKN